MLAKGIFIGSSHKNIKFCPVFCRKINGQLPSCNADK
jgi:hypothetical protein